MPRVKFDEGEAGEHRAGSKRSPALSAHYVHPVTKTSVLVNVFRTPCPRVVRLCPPDLSCVRYRLLRDPLLFLNPTPARRR